MFSKLEWHLVLRAATHPGWTCSSLGICPHGSGRPAFGDIVLPDFGILLHWIGHNCNAQGLRIEENLPHEIKICSERLLYRERYMSRRLVQNIHEGRGEAKNLRLAKWLESKQISSLLIPNLEAAGHYHLVHWWGVWDIIFTDLPRFRWKPRCFCYVLVQFDIFLPVLGVVCPSGVVFRFLFLSFMRVLPKCTWRLTFYKVQKQPARSDAFFGTVYILWSFGYICFDFCRFESPFWMPRCYPKIPISGTPSGRLRLPISHTCHPVYGAHEDEVLGGYHWLCLRFWLRHLMLYLFYRQRVVLRSSRMITAVAACDGDLKVCLHEVKGSTTERISRQDRGALACQIVVAVYMASSLNVCHGWMKKQVSETSFIFHFGHPAVAPGWGIFSSPYCNRSKLHLDSLSWPSCSPPIDRWLCNCHSDWCRKRSESGLGRFGCPCFQRPGIRRCKGWDWYFETRWRLQRKLSLVSFECP